MIVMFIDEAFETVVTTHNFGIPEIPGKLNGSFSEAQIGNGESFEEAAKSFFAVNAKNRIANAVIISKALDAGCMT